MDTLPPLVLRFRIRLMRFLYKINHVPGKMLYIADTLSRAPLSTHSADGVETDTEMFVQAVISGIPANKQYLDDCRKAQSQDRICSQLLEFRKSGWPSHRQPKGDIKKYQQFHSSFSVCDNLLLFGTRIVVPPSKQAETLQKIQQGYQGFQKCRLRVSESVWWYGVTQDLERFIKECPTVNKHYYLNESLSYLHHCQIILGKSSLLICSTTMVSITCGRYVEVQKLSNITSTGVISFLKAVFARHGIPMTLMSDNGPQFSSKEFQDFATTYHFHHITSSPHFPQSNGLAERTVRTMKKLLQGSKDPFMALLSYRTTPMPWCLLSPAELLMGCQLKTDVPQTKDHYILKWPHIKNLKEVHQKYKDSQSKYYNRRHRVRTLPMLPDDTAVWVQNGSSQEPGNIVRSASTPDHI